MLSGMVFLGGATIAQQTTVLSDTIKSQLVNVKAFLEKNGIDTSYLEFGNLGAPAASSTPDASATPAAPRPRTIFPAPAPSPPAAAPS